MVERFKQFDCEGCTHVGGKNFCKFGSFPLCDVKSLLPHEDGDWVRFEDYEKLAKELEDAKYAAACAQDEVYSLLDR